MDWDFWLKVVAAVAGLAGWWKWWEEKSGKKLRAALTLVPTPIMISVPALRVVNTGGAPFIVEYFGVVFTDGTERMMETSGQPEIEPRRWQVFPLGRAVGDRLLGGGVRALKITTSVGDSCTLKLPTGTRTW